MKEIKLTELEIKILKLIGVNSRRYIKRELSLTQRGAQRIFNKFKELGLTEIIGVYDCSRGEPRVGRFTVLSKKGKELLDLLLKFK